MDTESKDLDDGSNVTPGDTALGDSPAAATNESKKVVEGDDDGNATTTKDLIQRWSSNPQENASLQQNNISASGAKFRSGWSKTPKVPRHQTQFIPSSAGGGKVDDTKDAARRSNVSALVQSVNRAAEAERKRALEEEEKKKKAEESAHKLRHQEESELLDQEISSKRAELDRLGRERELLAKRTELERLEMQRLEQERIVAEQRKETDAASAAAAAAAIADGVASADVTFQKEPNDGLEEVEAGPSIGQAASALSKDDKQPDEPKKKWWQQRNSRLASLLLLLLIVGGIVVGVVLGLGKSDNDDDGDASLALDDGMAVVMSLGNDTDSTDTPTLAPTAKAGDDPTASPSLSSTDSPSKQPTSDSSSPGPMESSFTINRPKPNPTTDSPSKQPATPSPVTNRPTRPPTSKPVKDNPTNRPTPNPTTRNPTRWPTARPVTRRPTNQPTQYPITRNPTRWPTARPVTSRPTNRPTQKPITDRPTNNAPLAPTPVIVDRSCEYRKSQTVFVSASPNFVNQQMFGGGSDFDGDTAIVVNYDSGMSYLGAGAVWILERKNGIWAQADAFQSLDQEQFGWGIVVKGDSIVVGAPGYDGMMNIDANLNMYWFGRGRAMVGRRDDSGSWYQEAILSPNDLEWNAGFGNVLDIADCECLIAVGAWNDRDRRGSVYVYSKSNSGSWDQVQKLAPGFTRQSQDALFGNYGYTVVFSGDGNVLAVKSPYDYANGLRGAVYVYRQGIFGTYEEIEILSTPEGRQAETHNSDVTFIDNHLLVGAPGLGKVYVFRETNSGKYQKTAELTASDVGSSSQFGISLDGEGSNVMVGAQEGESSYLFSYDGNVWIERAKFNGVIAALSGSSIVAHNPPDFAMDSWLSSYGGEVNFYNLVCER